MAEVPKIVRERLRRASAGSHPDADTLTAFAERVLPERERGTILEHLAGCRSCREIMAVAVPFSEDAQVAVPFSRRPWLTWPALRWGFAAAGIALVASLGVVDYQRHSGGSMALYKAPVASEQKSAAASVAAPPPPLQDSKKELDKTRARAFLLASGVKANKSPQRERDELAQSTMSAPVSQGLTSTTHAPSFGGTLGGPLVRGPRANVQMNQANQWQQNANTFDARAAADKAAAPPVNQPANGRSLFETQTEPAQTAENLTLQSQTLSQQSPQGGTDESKVDRAKPLETVSVGPPKAYAENTASAKLARSTAVAGARWAINSSGGLERSLDQGATWQDVNVNTSPAAASGISLVSNERKDRLESYAKKEKQTSPIVFRAIAANGPDVWVGGVNGALYHSTDGGIGWTRVVPSSNDVILTGDVVSVNFPDALHGRIQTSTSEAWVTGDGGQSWDKK